MNIAGKRSQFICRSHGKVNSFDKNDIFGLVELYSEVQKDVGYLKWHHQDNHNVFIEFGCRQKMPCKTVKLIVQSSLLFIFKKNCTLRFFTDQIESNSNLNIKKLTNILLMLSKQIIEFIWNWRLSYTQNAGKLNFILNKDKNLIYFSFKIYSCLVRTTVN